MNAIATDFYRPQAASPAPLLPLMTPRVSAGFPSPAEDEFDHSLNLHQHLVKNPSSTFFIRVSGHSMRGAGIRDGDLLVVDKCLTPRNGDIVIAIVNGEFLVKRLTHEGPHILLKAEHPAYPPIPVQEGCEIWGVVVSTIHVFR